MLKVKQKFPKISSFFSQSNPNKSNIQTNRLAKKSIMIQGIYPSKSARILKNSRSPSFLKMTSEMRSNKAKLNKGFNNCNSTLELCKSSYNRTQNLLEKKNILSFSNGLDGLLMRERDQITQKQKAQQVNEMNHKNYIDKILTKRKSFSIVSKLMKQNIPELILNVIYPIKIKRKLEQYCIFLTSSYFKLNENNPNPETKLNLEIS